MVEVQKKLHVFGRSGPLFYEAQLYGSVLTPVNGRISVPEGAGMGMDPDPNVFREYLRAGTETRA